MQHVTRQGESSELIPSFSFFSFFFFLRLAESIKGLGCITRCFSPDSETDVDFEKRETRGSLRV